MDLRVASQQQLCFDCSQRKQYPTPKHEGACVDNSRGFDIGLNLSAKQDPLRLVGAQLKRKTGKAKTPRRRNVGEVMTVLKCQWCKKEYRQRTAFGKHERDCGSRPATAATTSSAGTGTITAETGQSNPGPAKAVADPPQARELAPALQIPRYLCPWCPKEYISETWLQKHKGSCERRPPEAAAPAANSTNPPLQAPAAADPGLVTPALPAAAGGEASQDAAHSGSKRIRNHQDG